MTGSGQRDSMREHRSRPIADPQLLKLIAAQESVTNAIGRRWTLAQRAGPRDDPAVASWRGGDAGAAGQRARRCFQFWPGAAGPAADAGAPVSTQPLYGRLGVNSGAFIGLVADEPPARRASRVALGPGGFVAPGTECSRSSVRWSGSALQVCGIVCLIGPADRRPSRQPAATSKSKPERIGCAPLTTLNALRRPRP